MKNGENNEVPIRTKSTFKKGKKYRYKKEMKNFQERGKYRNTYQK